MSIFSAGGVTPRHLAQHFGVSPQTILNWVKQGRIPAPQRINARVFRWPYAVVAPILEHGPDAVGHWSQLNAEALRS